MKKLIVCVFMLTGGLLFGMDEKKLAALHLVKGKRLDPSVSVGRCDFEQVAALQAALSTSDETTIPERPKTASPVPQDKYKFRDEESGC